MFSYNIVFFSILFGTAVSGREKFFDPCNQNDIKCLSEATENFLGKSCNGLPDYDIKPLDPLIIPELRVALDDGMGLALDFTNINVTGLKNQQIFDFKMDTERKSVVLKTKAVLNIAGNVKITFTKKNKAFTGTYTASATALGSSQYGYSLTMKDNEEYFELGPETNTCEIIGEPVVSIQLNAAFGLKFSVSDAGGMDTDYETKMVSLRKKTICKIVETAYITVIHNIRALAKFFPKSAFFKDV